MRVKILFTRSCQYKCIYKFGQILSVCSKDVKWKRSSGINHNSGTNVRKMMCNNPNLDLVNLNAYIKFDENLTTYSQDI